MTSFALKWIAVVSMLIDHAGLALVPRDTAAYLVCRAVGRLAFPLFAFLLAEGFFYTKNVKKYLFRLCVFALVSELPYDWLRTGVSPAGRLRATGLPVDVRNMNVFVTLALALLGLWLFDGFAARGRKGAALLAMLAAGACAALLNTDYGAFGVLMVFLFYRYRTERKSLARWFTAVVVLYTYTLALGAYPSVSGTRAALLTVFELPALIPILRYSRRKGFTGKYWQYFFYAFYPLHMAALCAVKVLIK